MVFPGAVEQAESSAELGVQTLSAVSHDLQTAAPCRPIRPEASHDDVAPRSHDPLYLRHITGPIPCVSKEVKNGSVMPYGTGGGGQWRIENVCNDPLYLSRALAQTLLRTGERCWGQVEDRDVSVAGTE
jgi:hypothetical protein